MPAPKVTNRKISLFFFFTLLFICSDISAETLREFDREIRDLLHRVQSSVVTIQTYRKVSSPTGRMFPFNPELIDTQIGTGVVYDTNGHILTTGHVVRGGSDFEVFARDGRKFKAVISGIDPEQDVALLQIAPNQLSPLPLRTSAPVAAGSILFAVGNSFGIPNAANLAVAVGYRSNGSLQVSANLAPGFSGGPVVDVEGRMVGLISAKLTEPVTLGHVRLIRKSPSGTSAIDFTGAEMELPSTGVIIAISSSDVQESAVRLIEGERSGKGFLGIRPDDMDPAWAARAFNVRHGVIISEVMQDSPAWEAGIRTGDILTQYLGRRIVTSNQLRKLIATGKKGDVVSLTVMRGGRSLRIAVQLSSLEAMNIAGQVDLMGVPIDSTVSVSEIPIQQIVGEDDYRRQMQSKINALRIELRRQMKKIESIEKELSRSQGSK